jgi:hypothetical protein
MPFKKSQRTGYSFTVDHPQNGYLQIHFEEDVSYRSRKSPRRVFAASDVDDFNLDDPVYDEWFSPVAMALVDNLIRDGRTGVEIVVIPSRKVIKVIYNPELVRTYLLKGFIRQIIDYADDYGWRPQVHSI